MRKLLILPFVLFVVACGTTKDLTSRDALAVAESQYQAATVALKVLTDRGFIKGQVARDVKRAVLATRAALDAWHLTPDNVDVKSIALATLDNLRTMEAGVSR